MNCEMGAYWEDGPRIVDSVVSFGETGGVEKEKRREERREVKSLFGRQKLVNVDIARLGRVNQRRQTRYVCLSHRSLSQAPLSLSRQAIQYA